LQERLTENAFKPGLL